MPIEFGTDKESKQMQRAAATTPVGI